jgi:hypothetical protein
MYNSELKSVWVYGLFPSIKVYKLVLPIVYMRVEMLKKKGRNKPSKKDSAYFKKVVVTVVQCPYCQSWKTSRLGFNVSVSRGKIPRFKCNDCGHSFYLSKDAEEIK